MAWLVYWRPAIWDHGSVSCHTIAVTQGCLHTRWKSHALLCSLQKACQPFWEASRKRANINQKSTRMWFLPMSRFRNQSVFYAFACSAMRIAHLTTTLYTWACPAAKRTTMAAPTFPPASSSSAAPKSRFSYPHNSLPPNSPRTVGGGACRLVPSLTSVAASLLLIYVKGDVAVMPHWGDSFHLKLKESLGVVACEVSHGFNTSSVHLEFTHMSLALASALKRLL